VDSLNPIGLNYSISSIILGESQLIFFLKNHTVSIFLHPFLALCFLLFPFQYRGSFLFSFLVIARCIDRTEFLMVRICRLVIIWLH
jgi:hypothetical protein